MKYTCDVCIYETEDRRLWYAHNKTKKHIEKSNKMDNKKVTAPEDSSKLLKTPTEKNIICNFCYNKFARFSSLTRHLKICANNNIIIQSSEKIKQLEYENKFIKLEKENEMLKKENMILSKENEFHKQLVISAGTLINSSMSTLNHLILNYNNAPILEPLKDYSFLEDTDIFVNNLIYYYNDNKLEQYLGNFLIKLYKTKDPSKQSNWNSDTSRLTYINRELINNKPGWVIDKKGVKMTEIIINPFLNHIKMLSQHKIKKLEIEFNDNNDGKNIFLKMTTLTNIIQSINNKEMSKNINRYIAPHFYFDKNNVLMLKDDNGNNIKNLCKKIDI